MAGKFNIRLKHKYYYNKINKSFVVKVLLVKPDGFYLGGCSVLAVDFDGNEMCYGLSDFLAQFDYVEEKYFSIVSGVVGDFTNTVYGVNIDNEVLLNCKNNQNIAMSLGLLIGAFYGGPPLASRYYANFSEDGILNNCPAMLNTRKARLGRNNDYSIKLKNKFYYKIGGDHAAIDECKLLEVKCVKRMSQAPYFFYVESSRGDFVSEKVLLGDLRDSFRSFSHDMIKKAYSLSHIEKERKGSINYSTAMIGGDFIYSQSCAIAKLAFILAEGG